jgi:hypothetical protein
MTTTGSASAAVVAATAAAMPSASDDRVSGSSTTRPGPGTARGTLELAQLVLRAEPSRARA